MDENVEIHSIDVGEIKYTTSREAASDCLELQRRNTSGSVQESTDWLRIILKD
jgi:hypothetical protein